MWNITIVVIFIENDGSVIKKCVGVNQFPRNHFSYQEHEQNDVILLIKAIIKKLP